MCDKNYDCPIFTGLYWGAEEEPKLFFGEPLDGGGTGLRVGKGLTNLFS